ncbi:LuxR C-terminal-related transcriptional regulator [Aestuariibaculum lutulentum]|uniref:LuxR C-terminal-related transcriptional regulator n=1 Tax=Aestuariibaculum lutulentum TaxID=2920935 RepID=A0ABS9RHM6_9FLAO|nr:LuxR C-terminal-related transcriptional regulator [Aestuariibaculum lutulentum]MCH4552435.1 LuxR C-terminal-related transcriptional regulator [Aestuariibaculum lutulentum]
MVSFTSIVSGQRSVDRRIKYFDSLSYANNRAKNFDLYFQHFIKSESLIHEASDTFLKTVHYYQHSTRFYNLGLYKESIQLAKKGIALDNDFNNLKTPNFTLLTYTNIAKSQSALKQYHEAKNTYITIYNLSKKVNLRRVAAAANNLGLFYLNYDKNQDSALFYFKQAKQIMISGTYPDQDLTGFINDNIADILIKQHAIKETLPLYKENFHRHFSPHRIEDRIKSAYFMAGIKLANSYTALNNTRQAMALLDSVKTILDTTKTFQGKNVIHLDLLKSYQGIALKQNNYKKVHTLTLNIDSLNTAIVNEEENALRTGYHIMGSEASKKYARLLNSEKRRAESIKQKSKTRFWIVTTIFLLGLGGIFILYYREKLRLATSRKHKKLAEQKAASINLKNKLLSKDVEQQKKDITNLVLSNEQHNQWLDDLQDMLQNYQNNTNFNREQFLEELTKMIDNKKRTYGLNDQLQQKITEINTEFYSNLESKHPDLTSYELNLCTLMRINLSSKDIATVLNITPSSVNTSRYRLRKKLNLEKDNELKSYLKAF